MELYTFRAPEAPEDPRDRRQSEDRCSIARSRSTEPFKIGEYGCFLGAREAARGPLTRYEIATLPGHANPFRVESVNGEDSWQREFGNATKYISSVT